MSKKGKDELDGKSLSRRRLRDLGSMMCHPPWRDTSNTTASILCAGA